MVVRIIAQHGLLCKSFGRGAEIEIDGAMVGGFGGEAGIVVPDVGVGADEVACGSGAEKEVVEGSRLPG